MKEVKLWNRRDFVTRPVAAIAASTLLSGSDALFAQSPSPDKNAPIIHRTLGKTGISLPIVSMGVMNADIPGVLGRAYELGVRHFDTAAYYQRGRNEEMVGRVIKDLGARDKVVVATKIYIEPPQRRDPGLKAQFRTIFEGSLKRLQMDHVDILYYHSVDQPDEAALQEPLEALSAFKKEGKTRFIGISTHNSEQILRQITKAGTYDVVLFSLNYTMDSPGLIEAIDQAAAKGIGLVAMKTQAGGRTRPDPKLMRPLTPASQTALLKWVMRNKSVATAIPGFSTYEHLEQGFSVARNLEYTQAEKEFLGDKNVVAEAEFCVQCGNCRPDCPLHVDVPTLMRSHMYAVQYSNHGLAHDTLAGIKAGKGLDACGECSTCKVSCRRTVNVARKISDLKEFAAETRLV